MFIVRKNFLIAILCFSLKFFNNLCLCFNVNSQVNQNVKVQPFNTEIYKREFTEYFDKASYSFNGFQKVESVPVLFPIDICLMTIEGVEYATALHMNRNGERQFVIFRKNNDDSYTQLAEIQTPLAIDMDCLAMGSKGYVAVAFNITTERPIVNARDGSPIYEIAGNRLRAVQYFSEPNLASVYLRLTGNDLFLLQTFASTKITPNLFCPFFKWSGSTFTKVGGVPCSNARHLELFSIEYESYVAVANYADQRGRTDTFSQIYKYSLDKQNFQLFQKIKTNGAVDVRHFRVPYDEVKRKHFLVFGNSRSTSSATATEEMNLEAESVIYVFDKSEFVPYQQLTFYAIEQFLPVQNLDAEKFLLLVACSNQDIKIYNLNDWKFEESEAQFTEGALGRGVAKMRIYQQDDTSHLVIANELMMANETNVFVPIFRQDEHANALRQEIVDWTKVNIARLADIDVERMQRDVETKLLRLGQSQISGEIGFIPQTNINKAITRSLIYPRMRMGASFWKALSYANQALDILETSLSRKSRQKRESPGADPLPNYSHVKVENLNVRHLLKAKKINGIEMSRLEFDKLTAKELIVSDQFRPPIREQPQNKARITGTEEEPIVDVMTVDDLIVDGKFGQIDWSALMNFTLKRSGEQFVKAPAAISNLQAESVLISTNAVKGRDLGKLVPIDGGRYVVDQEVQFAEPVSARQVIIHDRLNNIHVVHKKFDVLLKQSNETQVVEGRKRIDQVKVLEPITISGHLTGRHLEDMAPNKAVHEDLILHGNFSINGNVSIGRLMRSHDIEDETTGSSVREALAHSIRLDGMLEDINLHFEQPLQVNNSRVSFINAQDIQRLLRTNIDEVQLLPGEKSFSGSLEIRKGFSEVQTLNGIDVEALEQRLLTKHTNQHVRGSIHVGKAVVKSIQSPNLKLNGKPIELYLTKSGDQVIKGSLRAGKLHADTMEVDNLNTNGRIFNEQLTDIYQQKSRSDPSRDIFHKNSKFHGSIYVRNLITDASINRKPIEHIERQLSQLNGNIKYVGNYKFNHDTNTTHLTFRGKFNGISADEFGQCWLQKTAVKQRFTAPQTLAGVKSPKGVQLMDGGTLNGYRLEDFYEKTYWINRNEWIGRATLENPTLMQGTLKSAVVNGLRIPGDLLYRQSSDLQVFHIPGVVFGHLLVGGDIANVSIVNGMHLPELHNYLSGNAGDTLYVEHGNFSYAPTYRTLNQRNLRETLDTVWLANENVEISHHVEISDGNFEGLLEFEGPINNMNMKYLRDNYVSLSRAQDIDSELIFKHEVQFQQRLNMHEMHLQGPIIESKSNIPFNFNEFVSNTLKTSGPHQITGQWRILEAIIQGELKNVLINNLNLANDVLRMDAPPQLNEITAAKHLKSAVIKKLYANSESSINEVPVARWVTDTVYVYENYTIHGTTTLDTVNLYNNLIVHGKVNNITFDDQTLLLRDHNQFVKGNITIRNKFNDRQMILTNNIEHLQTEVINGVHVDDFFDHQAKRTLTAHVQGHLIFTEPVQVGEYHGGISNVDSGAFNGMPWKREINEETTRADIAGEENWEELERSVMHLEESLYAADYILEHFEVRQTLSINATKLMPLSHTHTNGDLSDVLVVFTDNPNNPHKYFVWNQDAQQFAPEQNISWLPHNALSTEILKAICSKTCQQQLSNGSLRVEKNADIKNFMRLLPDPKLQINSFHVQGKDCWAVHAVNGSLDVSLYCLKFKDPKHLIVYKEDTPSNLRHAKQIIALTDFSVAILTSQSVEIRNSSSDNLILVQSLPIAEPKQLSVSRRPYGTTYVAVISALKSNSLRHGTIEIYSSSDEGIFEKFQTLNCPAPREIGFSYIEQSNDLLLHVITTAKDQPLVIYQYRGVLGFEKILGTSILPRAEHLQLIELKSRKKSLLALLGKHEVTFVEIIFRKL